MLNYDSAIDSCFAVCLSVCVWVEERLPLASEDSVDQ